MGKGKGQARGDAASSQGARSGAQGAGPESAGSKTVDLWNSWLRKHEAGARTGGGPAARPRWALAPIASSRPLCPIVPCYRSIRLDSSMSLLASVRTRTLPTLDSSGWLPADLGPFLSHSGLLDKLGSISSAWKTLVVDDHTHLLLDQVLGDNEILNLNYTGASSASACCSVSRAVVPDFLGSLGPSRPKSSTRSSLLASPIRPSQQSTSSSQQPKTSTES